MEKVKKKTYKVHSQINKKNWNFSVIIPIYNTEQYLDEAIQSIINQSLSFRENIQLILVNDGSSDSSGIVCKKYLEKYPNNIIYIEQDNSGVSQARNLGMKYASGTYTNFLDSDDYLDINIFREVNNFILNHKDCNVIALNIENFEEAHGSWISKDYFAETKIIDLQKEPEFIHLSSAASFIKTSVAKRHIFNKNLKILEDAQFLYSIFRDNKKCGVISDKYSYWHRVRNANNSATQSICYDETIKSLLNYLFNDLITLYKKKYDKIPKFLQSMFVTELNYYVLSNIHHTNYNATEKKEVIELFSRVIDNVDIDYINTLTFINDYEKKRYKFLKRYPNKLFDPKVYDNYSVDDSTFIAKILKYINRIVLFLPKLLYRFIFYKTIKNINTLQNRISCQEEDINKLKSEIKQLKKIVKSPNEEFNMRKEN